MGEIFKAGAQQELVSIKTLCLMLDIKERTIRDWVSKRIIPHHKLNRMVRFNVKEIKAWYDARLIPADQPELERI